MLAVRCPRSVFKQALRPRSPSAPRASAPRAMVERLVDAFNLIRIDEEGARVAYERGDALGVEQAVRMAVAEESLLHALQALILLQLEAAGKAAARQLERDLNAVEHRVAKQPAVVGAFDLVNERAVEFARARSAELVSRASAATREAVRELVARSLREGRTVEALARDLHEVVGLLPRQARALRNFRRRLEQEGEPAARVRGLAARYRERLLLQRGRLIARTELASASTWGQQELWRQAAERNLIDARSRRRWIVTQDELLCPRCAPMQGQKAALGQAYPNGVTGPPLHPACRCAEALDLQAAEGHRT